MNKTLQSVLLVAEQIGRNAIPGGGLIDDGVHAIIDKKVSVGAVSAAEGALLLIEEMKGVDIADNAQFNQGVSLIATGLELVKRSLKPSVVSAQDAAVNEANGNK